MVKNKTLPLLSVIVPVYNQEKTIAQDVLRIKEVLDQLRYDYEIIVVVDGFEDSTYKNAKKTASSKVIVTGYEKNYGKGYAVRYGISKAKGDIIAFIDSDMDINPNGISMLLEHFEWYDADVIVGSKLHPVSKVNYPLQRKILSWGYRLLVKVLFGLSVKDTQVGLKFFKRKVVDVVMPRLLVKRYAFDIEILAVAYYLGYRRIYEAPIELDFNRVSSLGSQGFRKTIILMLMDTLAVYYRLKILHYYDDRNKKNWISNNTSSRNIQLTKSK